MILLYYDITFDQLKMTRIDKVDFLKMVEVLGPLLLQNKIYRFLAELYAF